MALSSNATYDRDADGDTPLRRRKALSCFPTPLRTLEWRYVPSNGSQGGGEGTVNSTRSTSRGRGRGRGAWWTSSSGGTIIRPSSSFDTSSSADDRQTCSFDAMDEDKAFFETYGITDEGGGRAGIRLVARQLAIGVQVLCTIGRAVNSCTLSIIGDGDEGFDASRGVSVRLMGVNSTLEGYLLVPLVDVSEVVCEPRGPKGVITCGIRKPRGGGSKILSVVCLDRHGAPAAGLTKAFALVLAWNAGVMMEAKGLAIDLSCAVDPKDVWQAFSVVKGGQDIPSNGVAGGKVKDGRNNDRDSTTSSNGHGTTSNGHGSNGSTSNGHGGTSNGHGGTSNGPDRTSSGHGSISSMMGRCGGQFASILEPAGLLMEYEGDFENSGLDFQDLAVVERKDLEEIVGITDRLHQIKIMTQIRRRFHAASSLGGGPSDFASGSSSGSSATAGTESTTTRRPWRLQMLPLGRGEGDCSAQMAGGGRGGFLGGDLDGDSSAGKTSEATPLL